MNQPNNHHAALHEAQYAAAQERADMQEAYEDFIQEKVDKAIASPILFETLLDDAEACIRKDALTHHQQMATRYLMAGLTSQAKHHASQAKELVEFELESLLKEQNPYSKWKRERNGS